MIPVTVFRIVDGDTVVGTIHLPFECDLRNQEIRALDYDAWESRKAQRSGSSGVTPEEIQMGKLAKDKLTEIMSEAREVYLVPGKKYWDNFGRALGELYVENEKGEVESVAQIMRHCGHCRPERLTDLEEDSYWDDLTSEDDSGIV